jgi:type IV pilus assembly protein PilC
VSVLVVAFVVVTVIMIFVIPAFKEVFTSFGADLPAPTLLVMAMSDFFVHYWWAIFGTIFGGGYMFFRTWKRSEKMQMVMDRLLLRMPIFGELIMKSVVARWTRTLSTCSPPACRWWRRWTRWAAPPATRSTPRPPSRSSATRHRHRADPSMTTTGVFPNMVLQMAAIGEESGALDDMLGKAADFYEEEVDEMVKGLSSLMEPSSS